MRPSEPPSTVVKRSRRTRRPSYKVVENAGLVFGSLNRRRGVLAGKAIRVEVVVPTLRQVNARLRRAAVRGRDSDSRARSALPVKSEEVDVKPCFPIQIGIKTEVKSEQDIAENVARRRLAQMGYGCLNIKIPPEVLDATMTRVFASHAWGGRPSQTFPQISKEYTHGFGDFMYISLRYEPHAPCRPGAPGLIFDFMDDSKEWPKIMRLVVRVRPNAWQYMGQYKLTAAPPLLTSEWNVQFPEVKRKWATKLSASKFVDGGVKAKIVLQKRLGRNPTPDEIAIALRSREQFCVTTEEILRACEEGQALVRAWCMKCVDYDISFQRRIATGL